MTNKIPPSLTWLIDKYARTSGKIIKLKKKLSTVQQWIDQLKELENSLAVIEQTLKLHEIQIDVENIKPVTPRILNANGFKSGEAGKLVIQFLKSRYLQGPVSKSEIIEYLLQEQKRISPEMAQPANNILKPTKQLLIRLELKKYIIRMHPIGSNREGLWEINPKLMSHKLSE